MFPIRDHNPSRRMPVVTVSIIAANVLVFLAMLPAYGDDALLYRVFATWALIPARISAGDGFYTFFSSMFMHAGFMHIAGNMLFLWIFGDNLEDELGHVGFALFYLASGLGAALAQWAVAPFAPIPMVGASGAIAGVLGGYLLLYPRALVDVLVIFGFFIRVVSVPAWMMLGLWFLLQLFSGATSVGAGGGVAYWAHSGGFVVGFVAALPAWLRRGASAHWRQTRGRPPFPEANYRIRRTNVPRIGRRR